MLEWFESSGGYLHTMKEKMPIAPDLSVRMETDVMSQTGHLRSSPVWSSWLAGAGRIQPGK